MMQTILLLCCLLFIKFLNGQITSWSSFGSIPIAAHSLPSGSINNEFMYIFYEDGSIYKKTSSSYPSTFVHPSISLQISCDYSKCSTVINDRYIYILQGKNNEPRVLYIFDTMNEEWLSEVITLPIQVGGSCLTSDGSDYIYIVTGYDDNQYPNTLDYIQIYDINNKIWTNYTGMTYTSYYPGCAYYNNYVYVFGGYQDSMGKMDKIQIFDIQDKKWEYNPLSTLPTGLIHMRCIVGNDNLIYIIGGLNTENQYTNTVLVYDPSIAINSIILNASSSLNGGRANAAVEIINDQIIVCGGRDSSCCDELKTCKDSNSFTTSLTSTPTTDININPTPNPTWKVSTSVQMTTWSSFSSIPAAADSLPYGSINNEFMYIFYSDESIYKKGITSSWEKVNPSVIVEIYSCDYDTTCSTVIDDRYIYILQGPSNEDLSIYIFDTLMEEWLSDIITIPKQVRGSCITSDNADYIYIVSGKWTDMIQTYDVNNKIWTNYTEMPYPTYYHGCIYYNNYIYTFGGYQSGGKLDKIQIFDIENKEWKYNYFQKLATGMHDMRCIVGDDNLIYIIGGFNSANDYTNIVQVYDPSTNFMVSNASNSLNYARARQAVGIINNQIIVCGGRGTASKNELSSCEISNILTSPPTTTSQPTSSQPTSSEPITSEPTTSTTSRNDGETTNTASSSPSDGNTAYMLSTNFVFVVLAFMFVFCRY